MQSLPFEDASFSFVYSYNSIFHMKKQQIAVAIKEIKRVLKPGGLCFVNFLSTADSEYGVGEQVGAGEFVQSEHGRNVIIRFLKRRNAMHCLRI